MGSPSGRPGGGAGQRPARPVETDAGPLEPGLDFCGQNVPGLSIIHLDMRLLGHLPDERLARRFADHLLVKRMASQVEAEPDGRWAVWVHDDDHLARAAEDLTHVGTVIRQGNRSERLQLRVEHHEGVGAPIAQPHEIVLIDEHRVGPSYAAEDFTLDFQTLAARKNPV